MRLSKRERDAILAAVARRFGGEAQVYLFGSRVRDDARGGDIDLMIEAPPEMTFAERERARLATMTDIQLAIGDQKIDIVVTTPQSCTDRRETDSRDADSRDIDARPIVAVARSEGVQL